MRKKALGFAQLVSYKGDVCRCPDNGPVRSHIPALVRVGVVVTGELRQQNLPKRNLVRVDVLVPASTDELLRRSTEERAHRRVDTERDALKIEKCRTNSGLLEP